LVNGAAAKRFLSPSQGLVHTAPHFHRQRKIAQTAATTALQQPQIVSHLNDKHREQG
jgi:hypothetical protein